MTIDAGPMMELAQVSPAGDPLEVWFWRRPPHRPRSWLVRSALPLVTHYTHCALRAGDFVHYVDAPRPGDAPGDGAITTHLAHRLFRVWSPARVITLDPATRIVEVMRVNGEWDWIRRNCTAFVATALGLEHPERIVTPDRLARTLLNERAAMLTPGRSGEVDMGAHRDAAAGDHGDSEGPGRATSAGGPAHRARGGEGVRPGFARAVRGPETLGDTERT